MASVLLTICMLGAAVAQTNTITGLNPVNTQDANAQACITVDGLIEACQTLTPGFTELAFPQQATCLCYGWINTNAWEPNLYDQEFSSCNAYLSTGEPALYSQVRSAYGGSVPTAPCHSAGNVASATVTDSYGAAAAASLASAYATASPGLLSSATGGVASGSAGIISAVSNSLFPAFGSGSSSGPLLAPGTATQTGAAAGNSGASGSAAAAKSSGGAAGQQAVKGNIVAGLIGLAAGLL